MAIYVFPTNPAALGIVTQPDHTDPPVSLLVNITAALGTGVKFNAIEIEPMKDVDKTPNTGNIYIGQEDMDTSTGEGVLKTIAPTDPPFSFSSISSGNVFDPERLFLQAANDDDGAQIRGLVK